MAHYSIRRMTDAEQQAYRAGCDDANAGHPSNPRAHDLFTQELREAYERGYNNFAGENLNG